MNTQPHQPKLKNYISIIIGIQISIVSHNKHHFKTKTKPNLELQTLPIKYPFYQHPGHIS